MWPVQPVACHISGGGGDAVEASVRVGCPAVLLCIWECADGLTSWQYQDTPLLVASQKGHAGAVRVLVESKADIQARTKVAVRPVQPGVDH